MQWKRRRRYFIRSSLMILPVTAVINLLVFKIKGVTIIE